MVMHSIIDIPSLTVIGPFHRRKLQVDDAPLFAWLLRSVNPSEKSEREVLLLDNSHEASKRLPIGVRKLWESFSQETSQLMARWGWAAVPSAKRILREYSEGRILQGFRVTGVAYHHGAVPALIVDEVAGIKIAMLPEMLSGADAGHRYTDDERLEILISFERSLPVLLQSYFEQISFYLNAIFFSSSASDDNTLRYCLRIRSIITTSIRRKVELILDCPRNHPKSYRLACTLRQHFARDLLLARAVDSYAHLLVNHIYRFFCIKDRAHDYSRKLMRLRSESDLFGPDNVTRLKDAARDISNPSDEYLTSLSNDRNQLPCWLYDLCQVGALIAEITKATAEYPIDCPKIFLTYDFDIPESEQFLGQATAWLQEQGISANIIKGRLLRSADLRWAILARIWICDHHLFFVPSSRVSIYGENKAMRERDDWVLQELFYAMLLRHGVTYAVSRAAAESQIDEFRDHVAKYTAKCEIPQVSDAAWAAFLPDAKQAIQDGLHYWKRLVFDPRNPSDESFASFRTAVVDPAARRLIKSLLEGWCYFFEPIPWSIIQASIEGSLKKPGDKSTVRQLSEYVRERQQAKDPRFAWAEFSFCL